jgi:hypothetical protein
MMEKNKCINVKNVIMLKREPNVSAEKMRIMLIVRSVTND